MGERVYTTSTDSYDITYGMTHTYAQTHQTPNHSNTPTAIPRPPLTKGTLIVFPTTYNSEHKCRFGLEKVLDATNPNNVVFQWYGNLPLAEAHKPFYPGWVDPRLLLV